MSLNLTLRPELETWIREEATREGTSPESVAARVIEAHWAIASRVPHLSASESELLAKINEGFPEVFWQRYRELRDKLRAETLAEEERQELIRLNDQVEGKNAERIRHLGELSRLRGVTLPEIMTQLGIGPIQVPEPQ